MTQFQKFIHERKYLKNVSPRTLEGYAQSFKWLVTPTPTDDDLKSLVIRMREAGLKATSCNNRIRAIDAYLRWSGSQLHVAKLKEPSDVLPTFKPEDIAAIAAAKPKTFHQRGTIVLMLTLIDSGCRIDEILSLRWDDIDFDNLLITVRGKGDKERRIRRCRRQHR
jgi:integrase/recombinase XerD